MAPRMAAPFEEMSSYELLGVPRYADPMTIRQAFIREALRWHPDKRPNDNEKDRELAQARFVAVHAAYETLKNSASTPLVAAFTELFDDFFCWIFIA